MSEIPVDPLANSDKIVPSEMMVRIATKLRSLPFPQFDPEVHKLHFWYPAARAAIEAMREPTEAMVESVIKHPDFYGYGDDGFDWVWRVMVDESLK